MACCHVSSAGTLTGQWPCNMVKYATVMVTEHARRFKAGDTVTVTQCDCDKMWFCISRAYALLFETSFIQVRHWKFSIWLYHIMNYVTACCAGRPGWPGPCWPGIWVGHRCKGSSVLCWAARQSAYKGTAGDKTSNKYLRYYSAMEAHEDSLLQTWVTAAADNSESTTILVSEGSSLPWVLQQVFEDGTQPAPSALLVHWQVLQLIAGHNIPIANISIPTRETELVYLLAIINYGTVC